RALVERAGLGRRCVRPRPRTSRSRHPERHQCGGNRLPHINPEDSEEVNDDSGGTATVVTYREDSVSARDQVWFARDSPLEEDGFELVVPLSKGTAVPSSPFGFPVDGTATSV